MCMTLIEDEAPGGVLGIQGDRGYFPGDCPYISRDTGRLTPFELLLGRKISKIAENFQGEGSQTFRDTGRQGQNF